MGVIIIEYLTQRVHLKHLSDTDKEQLATLAFQARMHYNDILDILEQYYLDTGRVAPIKFLLQMEKQGNHYLGSKFYVSSLARKNYLKTAYSHSISPGRHNGPLSVSIKASYKEGMLIIPATQFTAELSFPVELSREAKYMKLVNLIPVRGSLEYWEAAILYEIECPPVSVQSPMCELTCAAIDIGIENFATIATNNLSIENLIIDGRRVKSIIHRYKKSSKDYKKQIQFRNQLIDYVNKAVQIIVDYCVNNNVKVVILGEGLISAPYRFQNSNYFISLFPFAQFRSNLITKLKLSGIVLQEVPEAFTSQASFIDGDYIPRNVTKSEMHFSGNRKHRGLYLSREGYKLNADVNACYNLLAKSNFVNITHLREHPELLQKLTPVRIDPLNL